MCKLICKSGTKSTDTHGQKEGGGCKESREGGKGGGGLTAWDWHVEDTAAGVDLVLGRANGTINSHDN